MNNDFHQSKAIFSLFDGLEAPKIDQVMTLDRKVVNGDGHANHNGLVNGHSDHGVLANGTA